MIKKILFVAVALLSFAEMSAQDVKFYGVREKMRYDDGDDMKSEYLGWNAETGKAEFSGDYGLWTVGMSNNKLTPELVHYDNLMYGNSGALYIDGLIYTVFSHENPDATEDGVMEFVVRKWDAKTFELLSSERFEKSANLESRGMAYNPVDKQVYGLFYLTDVELPVPDEELDPEDRQEGYTTDAGYALCTIDLSTMAIKQITPGIYYDNFVTLACSPEGRMFSMTSFGTLYEFDTKTGLIRTKTVINEYGEEEQVSIYAHSGVQSQFRRQSACFDHNTGKMYWNGYVNNGMGYNDWGSYGPLSDKEWRTNGKYDTALYEVDIETGAATKIANVPNRMTFSCLWVDGGDGTEGAISDVKQMEMVETDNMDVYNTAGQLVYSGKKTSANLKSGIYVVKSGNVVKKVKM